MAALRVLVVGACEGGVNGGTGLGRGDSKRDLGKQSFLYNEPTHSLVTHTSYLCIH